MELTRPQRTKSPDVKSLQNFEKQNAYIPGQRNGNPNGNRQVMLSQLFFFNNGDEGRRNMKWE
jgi:hypothetical protein